MLTTMEWADRIASLAPMERGGNKNMQMTEMMYPVTFGGSFSPEKGWRAIQIHRYIAYNKAIILPFISTNKAAILEQVLGIDTAVFKSKKRK